MNILLLPGANQLTLSLLQDIIKQIGLEKAEIHEHHYDFWQKSSTNKSLDHEISRLPSDHFNLILAKSLGCLILLQALFQHRISSDRGILIGVPHSLSTETGFILSSYKILDNPKYIVIQQRDDPLGDSQKLSQWCSTNLIEIAGNDHKYLETELYLHTLTNWLNADRDANS